ncbi:MAG: ROK family protein [Syntrophomonadaceae bacterium]|jgi:predicted NBD/HSP70 family sugar kinase
MRFSQPTAARQINRLRVLNLIAKQDNLARSDVSRLLNLNKVSTSEIVDSLIKENLISEVGTRQTATGRRPTDLELNKDAQMIFAVEITNRNTQVALVNLKGEMLRFERLPTPKEPRPEEIAALIINLANKFTSRMKDPSLIKGSTIVINGEVEEATGLIKNHEGWQWNNVPLAFALSKHLKFPILIENSMKAMILGEKWFGNLEQSNTYYFVNWGEEIQGAFLKEGKILFSDSLFGHLPVAKTGICKCKTIGCLESQAAGWSLLEDYPNTTTLKQFGQLGETNRIVDSSLLNASEKMGEALIYIANILRPKKIVIGTSLPERYFNHVLNSFSNKANPMIKETPIERTTLGDQVGILGASALALDQFIFKQSLLEQLQKTASL